MPKRKCVRSERPLQNHNSVMRFKQVENRSHIMFCGKELVNAFMRNGSAFALCLEIRHPTNSYTGLMRLVSVSAAKAYRCNT